MTKMGKMTRHTWTEEDDALLIEMTSTIMGARDKRTPLWPAVSGAMIARRVLVSPDACRTRYQRIIARGKAAEEAEGLETSVWDEIAARVEQIEADQMDYVTDTVRRLEREIAALREDVAGLLAEWRGDGR